MVALLLLIIWPLAELLVAIEVAEAIGVLADRAAAARRLADRALGCCGPRGAVPGAV